MKDATCCLAPHDLTPFDYERGPAAQRQRADLPRTVERHTPRATPSGGPRAPGDSPTRHRGASTPTWGVPTASHASWSSGGALVAWAKDQGRTPQNRPPRRPGSIQTISPAPRPRTDAAHNLPPQCSRTKHRTTALPINNHTPPLITRTPSIQINATHARPMNHTQGSADPSGVPWSGAQSRGDDTARERSAKATDRRCEREDGRVSGATERGDPAVAQPVCGSCRRAS